jgi:hypothetical protein
MRKLFYLSLILLTSCSANINLDKEKDISIETPEEKSWNLTIEDKDISYVLIASTMESGDMQFSVETSLSEVKQTVMVSHFPNIKKYALADLNENEYKQLIFIGTSGIRPENELAFIFYLDTSEKPYQLKNIPLPEIEETDGRKKLNSINTYSIKPPYIERKSEYQPLEGELQKETIIYKITNDNQAEVVSIKARK